MNGLWFGFWTRRQLGFALESLLVFLLLAVGPTLAVAQEATPMAEEGLPEGVSLEIFAQAPADEVPAAPAEVGLFRVTIAPGASDDIEGGPGVELIYLEEGELAFGMEEAVTVIRAAETGTPEAGQQMILRAGDAFFVPAGASFSVANPGAEPAQALAFAAFPVEEMMPAEGTPMAEEEEAEGISFEFLAAGRATDMPAGPAVIGLGHIALEPGTAAPPEEPHTGPELIVLESGTVGITVTEGEIHHLRGMSMATPGTEPGAEEFLEVGVEVTLNAGDALFAQTGSVETARNLGDEPAVAIFAFIASAEHAEGEGA